MKAIDDSVYSNENIGKRDLLSDSVYKMIKSLIHTGKLKPGERINETAIMKQLSISQGPVREAIKKLEKDGLVKNLPYKGSFVETINDDEVVEVYKLRILLETTAIKWLLPKITDKDIENLQNITYAMQEEYKDNIDKLVENDMAFHGYICKATGSKVLYDMWSMLSGKSRIAISKYENMFGQYKDLGNIVNLHKVILDGIRRRDVQFTINAFIEHLGFAFKDMIKEGIEGETIKDITDKLFDSNQE